ncbi:hypothetical protein DFP73DRAFT_591960 [Morchella snyderi]|nr:hypothetical protein DFP73DRAFT_591960 [Morchella snyderi]
MTCSSACTPESVCSTCSTCSSSIRTIPSSFEDTRTPPEIEAYILFRSRRLMYEYNAMRQRELEHRNRSTCSLVESDKELAKKEELEDVQARLEDALNVVTATERLLRELKWWDEKVEGDVEWEGEGAKEAKVEKKKLEKKAEKKTNTKKILAKGQGGKAVEKKVEKKVVMAVSKKKEELVESEVEKVLIKGKKGRGKGVENIVQKEPGLISDHKGKGKQPEKEVEKNKKEKITSKESKGKGKIVEGKEETKVERMVRNVMAKPETSLQGAQRELGQYEWHWKGFEESWF